MKYLLFPLFFSLASCYVSQVGIILESDNSSDLKCTLYAPSNDPTGAEAKLYHIQKKAKSKNITFFFNKVLEKYTVDGKEETRYKYAIHAKLSSPEKAEEPSILIAEAMKVSPDNFWYKVYPIEDNEQEKSWKIAFAMKAQMKGKDVGQEFDLSVTMPEEVTEISPNKNAAGVSAKKNGKGAVFSYTQMKGSELYKFEVTAAKKKYVPPPVGDANKEASPATKTAEPANVASQPKPSDSNVPV